MAAWGASNRRTLDRWLGPLVSLALVLPLTAVVWAAETSEKCWDIPDEVGSLADNPEAATAYLDPGGTPGRDSRLNQLLRPVTWTACGDDDAPATVGAILVAATTGQTLDEQNGPAVPHTLPMAQVVHETVMVLGGSRQRERPHRAEFWREPEALVPDALKPYLATMLTAYVGDLEQGLHDSAGKRWDEQSTAVFDRDTNEARVIFNSKTDALIPLRNLVTELTTHPEAYATLYDAFRSSYAHYLDHVQLDSEGVLTAGTAEAPRLGEFTEFWRLSYGPAVLARLRALHIEKGTIEDTVAFDLAVLEHSRGVVIPTPEPLEGPAWSGDIARRAPAASAHEWEQQQQTGFLDGRQHLLWVLDTWATDQEIPPAELPPLHAALEEGYLFSHAQAARTFY
ncbi:hypothetical protein ACWGIB_23720 [Streptomyces xiamenensis]